MSDLTGQSVSHYRITAAIGSGGMGEVYRATDTNLSRDVAVKVLPAQLLEDGERLARFKREAQVLAALNHLNIAGVHGFEEVDGKPFLFLELVEGEDLQHRLERGFIPVPEALEIARQIAEALGEAHRKGIVHRDLKPGNVKVTPDGTVKVLDFGLAKVWAPDDPEGSASTSSTGSDSPTRGELTTAVGMILGTAAYMSPEQATGKAVDKRADIWAFGVVLFEMLSGRQPFAGETASESIAAILRDDPPWEALPRDCPPSILRLLRRCLRKRLRHRLQDIGDARIVLSEVLDGGVDDDESVAAPPAAASAGRRRERWAWAILTLALTGLSVVLGWRGIGRDGTPPPVLRFDVPAPSGVSFAEDRPVISPDGRQLAFVGERAGERPRLWIRSLDALDARELPGTEGARLPFWSPDSRSLAFATEDALIAVRTEDGASRRICELPGPRYAGADWGSRGTIVFSAAGPGDPDGRGYTLFTVSAGGATPVPLTTLDEGRGEERQVAPLYLPGEREILCVITGTKPADDGFFAIPLAAPTKRRGLDEPSLALHAVDWTALGDRLLLLYQQEGALLARPFHADSLRFSGTALPIAQGIRSVARPFSVSNTGTVAYRSASGSDDLRLTWFDRHGNEVGTFGEPAKIGQIALSPDGKRVAFEMLSAANPADLWIVDVARGLPSRATFDEGAETNPVWSPDGRELVYEGRCTEGAQGDCLFRLNVAAGGAPHVALRSEREVYPESWSRVSDALVYLEGPMENRAIRTVSMAGGGRGSGARLLLQTGFGLDEAQVSPDGRWLAYLSNDSGPFEAYIQPFGILGERVRVSAGGAGQPKWSSDGRELFYVSSTGQLMSASVRSRGDTLVLGEATPLFNIGHLPALRDTYVPAPDGRFLVAIPAHKQSETLRVVVNWPSLIR
jgi:hypothetical protein